jgi:hypothetical protein
MRSSIRKVYITVVASALTFPADAGAFDLLDPISKWPRVSDPATASETLTPPEPKEPGLKTPEIQPAQAHRLPTVTQLTPTQMAMALEVPEYMLPVIMKKHQLSAEHLQELAQIAKRLNAGLGRLIRLSEALKMPIQRLETEIYTPHFERVELQLLQKLAATGSGKVLNDRNNRLSFDAWKSLPNLCRRAGANHFHVEWFGTSIYEWDRAGSSAVKVPKPMHFGHFKDLIFNRLPMAVNEPAVSSLSELRMVDMKDPRTCRNEKIPLVVNAKGYDFATQPETTRSELGTLWAKLAQIGRNRDSPLLLRINGNSFSLADMMEILENGAAIELSLAKPKERNLNKTHRRNRFDDYDKLLNFLGKLHSRKLHTRMTIHYNNGNLDLFLLDSREGREQLRQIFQLSENPL